MLPSPVSAGNGLIIPVNSPGWSPFMEWVANLFFVGLWRRLGHGLLVVIIPVGARAAAGFLAARSRIRNCLVVSVAHPLNYSVDVPVRRADEPLFVPSQGRPARASNRYAVMTFITRFPGVPVLKDSPDEQGIQTDAIAAAIDESASLVPHDDRRKE